MTDREPDFGVPSLDRICNIVREVVQISEEQSKVESERLRPRLEAMKSQLNAMQHCLDSLIADCDLEQRAEKEREIIQKFIDRYCIRHHQSRLLAEHFMKLVKAFSKKNNHTISTMNINKIMIEHFPQFRSLYHQDQTYYEGLDIRSNISELGV